MTDFRDGPAPPPGPRLVERIRARQPDIFLVIFRNKNDNVVVLQAHHDGRRLRTVKPVETYWLKIDKSDIKKRIKRNGKHDRAELLFVESTLPGVYRVDTKLSSDRKSCRVAFNMLPKVPLMLQMVNGVPRLFFQRNEKTYMVKSIFIQSTENLFLFPLSKNVSKVTMECRDVQTQRDVRLTIKG